ncbi:hypothetical protein ABT354_24320 [Streptomyces sp. NPDC000594]|uniref:hypothetical protein n=1 Tax=Streptomyces sp. NPDC000594 TaxID=3154261 RepID=UPI003324D6C7
MELRPTGAGTELDVRWRIADSTVDAADFIAGIEIGFGQSLDKLTSILTDDTSGAEPFDTDTRSTE